MKTNKEFKYYQLVLFAVVAEITLIALQYLILFLDPQAGLGFTTEYIKTKGFYLFQILGFFTYAGIGFYVIRRVRSNIIPKLVILVLSGGIIEISFYILSQATYEGAFLFSVLDKFVGTTFGVIVYMYTTRKAFS